MIWPEQLIACWIRWADGASDGGWRENKAKLTAAKLTLTFFDFSNWAVLLELLIDKKPRLRFYHEKDLIIPCLFRDKTKAEAFSQFRFLPTNRKLRGQTFTSTWRSHTAQSACVHCLAMVEGFGSMRRYRYEDLSSSQEDSSFEGSSSSENTSQPVLGSYSFGRFVGEKPFPLTCTHALQ